MSNSLWPHGLYSTLGSPLLHYLLEFAQIHVHWVDDAIKPSHPLLPPSFAFNLSQHHALSFPVSQLFGSGGQHIGASASVLPMNIQGIKYEWIFFRIDWFDFLAIQGTLKNLLKHHNSKASVLQHSAFSIVQLSHLYMTTGKTIVLTLLTFFSNMMSLLLIHCLGLP